VLGRPRCRIFFADNSKTYFAIYPGRERRGMESISFRVMTKQTASQAIYSFIPSSSMRTSLLLVFVLLPHRPFDFCLSRHSRRDLRMDLRPLFVLVAFLSHDVMTYTILGFWLPSLGLAGFVSPFSVLPEHASFPFREDKGD
jgi:hypothetical protein